MQALMTNALMDEYRQVLQLADSLFDSLTDDGMYAQPIKLRHPCIFYFGHLPAFAWNQIFRGVLRRKPFHAEFDELFERGIDPPDNTAGLTRPASFPRVEAIAQYKSRIETELLELLDTFGARGLADSDLKVALNMVLEHYMMHIETFVYMWHELNHSFKRNCFSSFEWHQQKLVDGQRRSIHQDQIDIPAGIATLGAARKEIDFGWCNEFGNTSQLVEQFQIDRFPVTNAEFAEFVDAGGYKQEQWWSKEAWAWLNARGHSHPHHWMRENQKWYYHGAAAVESLMENAPAWVSMCEASAFAHWRGGKLPTEAQFHRAAYANPSGEGESLYPWGESEPSASNGNFDLQYPAPTPIGQFPDGSSQFGVEELVGNGWEWTRTIFSPFPGFKPYPSYSGYSQDFFDDKHYVLKGGSPVTAKRLLRRSFRNWFQPHYPYVYAKFRCVYE